jgi:predicted RecB family nuclease
MTHTLLSPVRCEHPEEHLGLPRVTTILDVRNKPELTDWKLRIGPEEAERVSKTATDLGTTVHNAIERFLADLTFYLPEDYTVTLMGKPVVKSPQKLFNGFKNWYDTYQPTEIYIEQAVCDHDLGFIGRTDLIAKIDGKWYIVDFKTSKKFGKDMGLQLSAYAWAVERLLGIKIEGRMIVRLTDQTKKGYQVKEFNDVLPVFLSHLDIWYWLQEDYVEDPNENWDGGLIFAAASSSKTDKG